MPGTDNFFRGGSLQTFDRQARAAIEELAEVIDTAHAIDVWEEAVASTWTAPPVWFHGDMTAANLLARNGRLYAVIDFGCMGVGDPAGDLCIAWTFLSGKSREVFRREMNLDVETWARARGWILWKAATTLNKAGKADASKAATAGLQFGWRQNALGVLQDVLK